MTPKDSKPLRWYVPDIMVCLLVLGLMAALTIITLDASRARMHPIEEFDVVFSEALEPRASQLYRVVDREAGVVCYGSAQGIDCLGLDETRLD